MDYKFIIELGITIGGWCVMIGIYTQKIKQHDREIKELKAKQASTETILQSINNTLTSLDTKVDLLLKGKIIIQGDK